MAFGLGSRVQAQSALSLLETAHATLAHADHDYDGHRAKAMKEIQAAVHDLTGTYRVRVRTHAHVRHVRGTGNAEPQSQSSSDDQLRSAEGMLQQASAALSGDAFQRVNSAIAQLNTALTIR